MAYGFTPAERAALDTRARNILDACPDVGSLIRRGLAGDPERETLVYLRTALDPSPVVTRAGEFLGLLEAARIWLRQNGVGPGDVVAILASQRDGDGGRLLGGDELCRRPAAQSPVQPRGDRRTAQGGQGQDGLYAAARRARRPLREGRKP